MTIDFYDDLGEAFIRHIDQDAPPEMLKTAEWREPYDLLDRDFALIIIDGEGKEHRKFACFDEGNTRMSLWYLENVDHGLPDYAVKVAMKNLVDTSGIKLAYAPLDEDEKRFVIDEKRVLIKTAMPGTPAMPGLMGGATGKSSTGGTSPIKGPPMMSKSMPKSAPKAGIGASASGAPSPPMMTTTAASPYDVLAYVEKNWDDLDPFERHDAAVYLQKEGSAAGVLVPDHIHRYGGEQLNPRFESLMARRLDYVLDEDLRADYDRLGKMACAMDLNDVTDTLYLLDHQAHLTPRYGRMLPDPVLSVYGQEKQAEWSWNHGTDKVTEKQLHSFASAPYCKDNMGELFGDALCSKFRNDPVGTFKGLPLEQKIIVSHIATQSGYSNDGGYWR